MTSLVNNVLLAAGVGFGVAGGYCVYSGQPLWYAIFFFALAVLNLIVFYYHFERWFKKNERKGV